MATVNTNGIPAVIDGMTEAQTRQYAAEFQALANYIQALVEAKSASVRGLDNTAEVRRADEIRLGQHQAANRGPGVPVPASLEV